MMRSAVLAIETSQRLGSVAITRAGDEVDHEPLRATARHEDDLMPAIDRLCGRNRVVPRDIAAIGVSIGPGGFTGLRIAVSTAKMLAESLGAKIVAVPSALVTAEAMEARGPILVCLASKRETTWATRLERLSMADALHHEHEPSGRTPTPALPRALRFRERGSEWRIVGEPGLVGMSDLDLAKIDTVVADEFLPGTIRERAKDAGCAIVEPAFDARGCLAVAMRMLDAELTTDNLSLVPIYARPPEAVRVWKRKESEKQDAP